jgi:hypothetical protein
VEGTRLRFDSREIGRRLDGLEQGVRKGDAVLPAPVEGSSVTGPTEVTVAAEDIAAVGERRDRAGQSGHVLFTAEAFRTLVRSEYVAATNPVSIALRRRTVPVLDAAPDVAEAWVFGLYAAVLARLPDGSGRAAFTASLRRGSEPKEMLAALLRSQEGIRGAARAPHDLDEAFILGAYLLVFGRGPDADGLAGHLGQLRAHRSHQQVLDGLMTSDEAQELMRFPPAPIGRGRLIAEAMQRILYGVHDPDESVTQNFAAAYARGAGTRHLARVMLRRNRRLRGMLRSLFVSRNLARLIEIEASAHGARLEAVANRRWQWRVARTTWQRNDRLEARVGELSAATSHGARP